MKRISDNPSPHLLDLATKFREAQSRSQEQVHEIELILQALRAMGDQSHGGRDNTSEVAPGQGI